MSDWNPTAYARFRDLRLRPALDLLAQVPGDLPAGPAFDLGCGAGAVGPALRARLGARRLVGVDGSPAMLDRARQVGAYDDLVGADLSGWTPPGPAALLYSNAALHWLADHPALFARLAGALVPGGVLAVQMPRQFAAPSHRFLRDFAAEMFPDRFDLSAWEAPVRAPVDLFRLLAPLGSALEVWETDYVQRLDPVPTGHPVRRFTEATAMRPFLDGLAPAEAAALVARYEDALHAAYPPEADGAVLFPFRRLFAVLIR